MVSSTKITGILADGLREWPNNEQEYPRLPYDLTHELTTGFKCGIPLDEIRQGFLLLKYTNNIKDKVLLC